jgi:hypothetical protein
VCSAPSALSTVVVDTQKKSIATLESASDIMNTVAVCSDLLYYNVQVVGHAKDLRGIRNRISSSYSSHVEATYLHTDQQKFRMSHITEISADVYNT